MIPSEARSPSPASRSTPAADRLRRLLAPVEAVFDRVFGSAWNPLYQSGNIAVVCLAVATITGVYLFLFYRISEPYESVVRIDEVIWGGHAIRSLHRYSADLAVVASVLHLVRKLVQGHTWGPRARAWVTGIFLLGATLVCGWTGLVMAWDVQGQAIAIEGARLLDLLPVFSEPIGRMFTGAAGGVPSSFFFMNLFLHVALPLGVAGTLWLHVSRLARPAVTPPRTILWWTVGLLAAFSVVAPVTLPPKADLFRIPGVIPTDLFYAFWLPFARELPTVANLAFWIVGLAAVLAIPWVWRPSRTEIEPSWVDESKCAGCFDCYHDCPYDAISMVPRTVPSSLSEVVALVDPDRCVGCAICSASCAPMGVGPPDRTGRDQLREVRAFLGTRPPAEGDVVVLGCDFGLGVEATRDLDGVVPYAIGCSGSLHTSVIEFLLRSGYAGVYVLTCPTRDCVFREGPKWLRARVFDGRSCELRDRADKRRVAVGSFPTVARAQARSEISRFVDEVRGLGPVASEAKVEIELECETPAGVSL